MSKCLRSVSRSLRSVAHDKIARTNGRTINVKQASPILLLLLTGDTRIVGGAHGVHFTFSREGRPSGEAFVELASENDCQNALLKNNEHMGSRYIEGEDVLQYQIK